MSAGPAVIHQNQDDADETRVRGLIPFSRVNGNFRAPAGFVDINGGNVGGVTYTNGVVLVSQFNNCPLLQGGGTQRVLISDQSCNPSVVLDDSPGADDLLIDEIEAAQATVVNQDPNGEDSTDVTVFANVTLTRHWTPNLHSGLTYAREQGSASGLGGTVVGDSISLSNTWQITEKWQLAGRGDWGLRKSISQAGQVNTLVTGPPGVDPNVFANGPGASPVRLAGLAANPGGQGSSFVQRDKTTDIDSMRWGLAARATRFFTRNTSGYLQFTYNKQESQGDSLGDPSDFDDYLVTLGVQHVFAPIKLW